MNPTMVVSVIGILFLAFMLMLWVANRIIKAGPNEVLVISGRHRYIRREDGSRFRVGFRMLKGGRTFVWPFIERVDRLSLELMTLDVRTPEVYTAKGVPIIVDGIAQIKIKGDDISIATAAEQFLSMGRDQIRGIALQTVEGHLRAILGTLTVEETYSNRDAFAAKVQEVASSDLANMGLTIVSFTIRDIRDSQGYLDALGKPRTAQVKRDAVIGEAEAQRDSTIRSAQAIQEGQQAKFIADTKIAEAERDYQMRVAEYTASVNKEKAKADLAYDLQRFETAQLVKAQEVQVDIVEREKKIEVQEKEILRKQRELTATIEKPAEAEKFRVLTIADAERYKLQTEATGVADATKLKGFAEADVIQKTGESEAEANRARGIAQADVIKAQGFAEAQAMEKKAAAWRQYNEAAIVQMFVDKLPEIARAIAEPLTRTERIVIINNSGGTDGKAGGAGASKVTKDVTEIISQLPPVIESLTGIDMETLIKNIPAIKKGMFEEHGWDKPENEEPPSATGKKV
ncbi:MAG TPA: flotillin family protein [Firmicutes bacterium]|nr:flotillin family protein [Bacillota bacterium]